jgi:hypothetical protein
LEKRKAVVLLVFMIMVLSIIQTKPMVLAAHTGSPIDSGWASTSPVIDGNITAGEWSSATVVNFTLQMRSRSDGSLNRTLNGRLYVENNWTYAFLAVQIFNDDYEAHDLGGHYKGLALLFNDNNNGTLVFGDNGEGVTTWTGSPFYSHNDLYYAGSYWDSDFDAGKTEDGSLKWSHTNETQGAMGNWTFEMMIPLVGTDAGYDFNITSLPYTVGYKIWFQEPANGLDGVYPYDPTIPKSFDQTTNASTYGDMTFYPLYNLTMVATTGGTTTPAPGISQYPYKTVVSATATANPWYQFDHWELDGVNVGAANPYSVTMDQNHTLKAVFIPLYALTITATTGGTTTPTPGTYIYPNGTLVNVTATANSGYMFDHWQLDSVNVGASNPYTVTMLQNHTLNAVFIPLYALTITTTTGGTTAPTPGTYIYPNGTLVNVTSTANSGYTFGHWELDTINVGTANPYQVTMNQNHTLKAVFLPLYNLTIVTTGGGSTTPAPGTYTYVNGTNVSVNATANTGYVFDQWELDGFNVGTGNPYSVLMNQNHLLNATFVAQLSVTISPADSTITLGNSVLFTSNVTGGTPAYSYQWYLVPNSVTGATSPSWTFTSTSPGIYYVYLNVTDSKGRVAISNTARVTVPPPIVGGYSIPFETSTSMGPFACYGAFVAAFGAVISFARHKKKRESMAA